MSFQLCLVELQISVALFLWHAGQRDILAITVLGNHHGREELVLECHPINRLVNSLILYFTRLAQIVCTTVREVVRERGVAVLEGEALLLLLTVLLPIHIHRLCVWREESGHSLGSYRAMEEVVLSELIVDGNRLSRCGLCHKRYRVCRLLCYGEVKVSR